MTIDEMIEVLQAAKRGEVIQYRAVTYGDWFDNPCVWNFTAWEYRVKPKPRVLYRVEEIACGIGLTTLASLEEAEEFRRELPNPSSCAVVEYVEKLP